MRCAIGFRYELALVMACLMGGLCRDVGGQTAGESAAAAPSRPRKSAASAQLPPLPATEGQVWQEYDIQPYTSRVKDVEKPEQAVVDWVLRETGTDVWFGEPLALMNATKDTLRVYHVPAIQQRVKAIVDRLVDSSAESYVLGVRLLTVGSPNWRAKALPMLRPVPVQAPGVDAWLVSKEHASLLVAELRKRTDFREHSSPNLIIHNGQTHALTRRNPRNYMRSLRPRENAWLGFEPEPSSIQEGFELLLSPLMSLDGNTVDAVIKCQIDQVERFVPVTVDVPLASGQTQRHQVEVPQMVSWRLHERFRWPADHVLLLSCGVVAAPGPERTNPLGLPLPSLTSSPARADALLLLDCKGTASQTLVTPPRTATGESFQGRY